MNIKETYMKNYKKLLIIPIIIFAISLIIIFQHYSSTGEIVDKDVTLKGGLTITIYSPIDIPDLKAQLKLEFPKGDIIVRRLTEFGSNEQIGLLIEAAEVEEEELKAVLEEKLNLELTKDNYSVEQVGSSLGNAFYKQMRTALILAFIFMAIVILITFRAWIPAFTIVFCAFADMVFVVAIMNLFGMRLSTTGIAALLMLIGYSIDTDIVITTKALKRKEEGNIVDRMTSGVKTGLTMTISTVVALTVGYFVSQSYVIKEMFLIIILGLIFDVIMTYLFNTGVLVWWTRRKAKY
ncbi:MAG: hypothetical protein KKA65_01960 [Nanoarchaeota archaeon]|nr:hypothetical protein [Nanoarchaeota archaeon]MBU4352284.1 hypothetical protein [Nanoarchaeota archaeon]MBU4456242.1 hypothetical protein [Nanoarchaeota archaeon]MCG2719381.1 hypothetical protein [Nanoarchaeota archaeon]